MIHRLEIGRRKPLTIMIVAGEASGDKHGAGLARELFKLKAPEPIHIFGSGGEEMRSAGVETLVDARDVAIMGVLEIARSLGRFYKAYRTLVSAAISRKPDVVVLIDWPDFNLRLARRLHQYGVRVVYYVSPQVWAWRRYRVNAIRRYVNRMLVILPFEREFYQNAGIDAEYVGHPLVGSVRVTLSRSEFAERHGLDPSRAIVSLLPGSRGKEIEYHVPPMLDAARILVETGINWAGLVPSVEGGARHIDTGAGDPRSAKGGAQQPQFVIPLASTVDREQVRSLVQRSGVKVTLIDHDAYDALGHSCFAIVASGTATIETALIGTPLVIVYKGSELNWRLIRPLIHLDTFGMANLIAGRKIIPELIQHDLTGANIAEQVLSILGSPERLAGMRDDLAEVCRRLNSGGEAGYERAARSVLNCVLDQAGK
ncbi:MAG TPA: lipid-A-disaccharide synthase [Blastocatellia bacterium]|nr:lipid-A-disaccharide synthase [Blastocatellia bacterium]